MILVSSQSDLTPQKEDKTPKQCAITAILFDPKGVCLGGASHLRPKGTASERQTNIHRMTNRTSGKDKT